MQSPCISPAFRSKSVTWSRATSPTRRPWSSSKHISSASRRPWGVSGCALRLLACLWVMRPAWPANHRGRGGSRTAFPMRCARSNLRLSLVGDLAVLDIAPRHGQAAPPSRLLQTQHIDLARPVGCPIVAAVVGAQTLQAHLVAQHAHPLGDRPLGHAAVGQRCSSAITAATAIT